ncbi:hypothetical protein MNBD_DELTA02-1226 [hydrothermal vent metagenome]|uniref:4'-phosphopantetheinyl transferase domain-containing protein n=1 Tax=hydrothermal vent metagenome TaxID=652676 RepID=A0A3B0VGM0_9ZZZZ
MIQGLGIAVVDLPRFREVMDRRGERFLGRIFTKGEIEYCLTQRRPADHFGARYCAKLSYMKARGVFVPFKKIEVVRDAVGRPALKVLGYDETEVSVTMSHDGDIALAETLIITE